MKEERDLELSEESKKQKDSKSPTVSWLNALGGLLLAICFVTLVIAGVVFFIRRPSGPQVTEIHFRIEVDSTGVLSQASQEMVDSLFSLVNSQTTEIKKKYDSFINQKDAENGLLTFGGIIVSIIIAIFGFFGYRSFQSIEERAEKNAEGKAKEKLDKEMGIEVRRVEKKAMTEIQNRFEEEYSTKLKEQVASKLNESYNELISARLKAIQDDSKERETIKNNFEWFKEVVSSLQSQGIIISSAPKSEGMKALAAGRLKMKEQRESGDGSQATPVVPEEGINEPIEDNESGDGSQATPVVAEEGINEPIEDNEGGDGSQATPATGEDGGNETLEGRKGEEVPKTTTAAADAE